MSRFGNRQRRLRRSGMRSCARNSVRRRPWNWRGFRFRTGLYDSRAATNAKIVSRGNVIAALGTGEDRRRGRGSLRLRRRRLRCCFHSGRGSTLQSLNLRVQNIQVLFEKRHSFAGLFGIATAPTLYYEGINQRPGRDDEQKKPSKIFHRLVSKRRLLCRIVERFGRKVLQNPT